MKLFMILALVAAAQAIPFPFMSKTIQILNFNNFISLFFIPIEQGDDSQCLNRGGTCQNWIDNYCKAGYESGLCSGDANRRCCLACDATCE